MTKTAKDSRVTPEALIGEDEFRAMVQAADNPRDRAMLHVLFEAALRPGELLSMKLSSIEFKRDYCLITVTGKTGIKRIPLVASMQLLIIRSGFTSHNISPNNNTVKQILQTKHHTKY